MVGKVTTIENLTCWMDHSSQLTEDLKCNMVLYTSLHPGPHSILKKIILSNFQVRWFQARGDSRLLTCHWRSQDSLQGAWHLGMRDGGQ